jgi:PAS domain S-box-containing protein
MVQANEMNCKFLGYSPSELIGMHFAQFTYPDDLSLEVNLCKSLQEGQIQEYTMEKRYIRKDGEVVWGHLSVSLFSENQGSSKYTLAICVDINERKRMEVAIKDAHQRLLTLFNSMDAAIYIADMETYDILFVNSYTQNIYGNVIGKKCWQTFYEGLKGPCAFCTNDKLLDANRQPAGIYHWENYNPKVGRWYECHDNALPWIDGKMVRLEVAVDISNRKQMEEVIKTSLKEKETLLKEIHHRVKNNMQVISSLLNLQVRRCKGEQIKKALMDCQGRIQTMASVHEMLYKSDRLSVIDCQTYISGLANNIFQSYPTKLSRVKVTVDAKGVTLGIHQALPLGLIINELLSNALKYSFPENIPGRIMIFLKLSEKNMEFIFSDNGIGIPENIDWRNTKSLGLRLIVLLAENQLHGTISLNNSKGTCFTLNFRYQDIYLNGSPQ